MNKDHAKPELNIQSCPWFGQENGRIVVWVGKKLVFSKHYRNLEHREKIIAEINKIVLTKL